NAVKQTLLQHSGNVDRTRFEKCSTPAAFDPGHVVFAEAALKHLKIADDFSGPAIEGLPLSGKIAALAQRRAEFLNGADQRANAFKTSFKVLYRMTAVAQQREPAEETVRCALYR